MFTIEQNKKGKWYLKGDIDDILHMFNLSTAAELKVYVGNILGVKEELASSQSVRRRRKL